MNITQVFYSKLLRKSKDEGQKKDDEAPSQDNVINKERKN